MYLLMTLRAFPPALDSLKLPGAWDREGLSLNELDVHAGGLRTCSYVLPS